MIREIIKPTTINKYGRYFLSIEADDENVDPQIKPNTKVISVKPNNRSRKDFTDGAELPEEPLDDVTGDSETMDNKLDQNQTSDDTSPEEHPVDDGQAPVVNEPENPDANVEINTDDPNSPDINANTDYSGGAEDTTAPDTSDETGDQDFTADAGTGDDGSGEVPQDESEQPQQQPRGPGLEYDSTRKYNLFENYISLANALKNYISKFEGLIGDDMNENYIMKTCTEKLREIYQLCYDYMTMKFEISTYVQSLLFFQNLVVMVQMVFDLVSNKANKNIKK